jgi:ribulose-5-phosphate 4-epimerase/fuculose-1-phosphate aldolase
MYVTTFIEAIARYQVTNRINVGNFFYQDHSVYPNFGGTVLDEEEAGHIAKALGNNSAVILQNHGLLTVGHTVDEATYLYGALDRLCHGKR